MKDKKIRIGSYKPSWSQARLSIVAVITLEEEDLPSPYTSVDGQYIDSRKGLKLAIGFDIREGMREVMWAHEIPNDAWDTLNCDATVAIDQVVELNRIAKRWHLNGTCPWCRHQYDLGWQERPINPNKRLDSYGRHFPGQKRDTWNMLAWVSPSEHPEGLLSKPCPVCGYKYGTAWLYEPLPADVLAFLADLGVTK